MPFVETRLISPTTLTTSATSALYTVPTGYSAIIKQLVVTNITGTTATFTFYIGAASAGNALFSGTSVAANDTVIINLSQVLSTGEVLRALASTGSALNLTVSGVINDGPLASTATYIPDNAITSAKIAAGAIVNDDVNGSAAIAQTKIANLTSDLALKAPLASPIFTGTPSLPVGTTAATQITGNNTTAVATTAFANAAGGLVLIASQAVGSGVASVVITSCFSSTYDNYKIILNTTGSVAESTCAILGSSVSGYYAFLAYGSSTGAGGVLGATRNNTAKQFWLGGCAGAGAPHVAQFDLMNPYAATFTRFCNAIYHTGDDYGTNQGEHRIASSFTSITLSPSAGTFTGGNVSIYGYRK